MIVRARTNQERQSLLIYLNRKTGLEIDGFLAGVPFEILAVLRSGHAAGAVLYSDFRETTICMTWAGEPGWIRRNDLREMFAYPFLQLGALTAWGMVERSNWKSRSFCRRLGAREAGVLEHHFGKNRDAILYSMTRDKCRWIRSNPNEQAKAAKGSRSLQSRGGADAKQHCNGARASAAWDDQHGRPAGKC